uniref:Uncharacterized protein n=1 Tax=Arundo donax TaxID=35708 RepID=A0A0A8Z1Z8_ARUDO
MRPRADQNRSGRLERIWGRCDHGQSASRSRLARPRSPSSEHACGVGLHAAPSSGFSVVPLHEEAACVEGNITRRRRTAEAAMPEQPHCSPCRAAAAQQI